MVIEGRSVSGGLAAMEVAWWWVSWSEMEMKKYHSYKSNQYLSYRYCSRYKAGHLENFSNKPGTRFGAIDNGEIRKSAYGLLDDRESGHASLLSLENLRYSSPSWTASFKSARKKISREQTGSENLVRLTIEKNIAFLEVVLQSCKSQVWWTTTFGFGE